MAHTRHAAFGRVLVPNGGPRGRLSSYLKLSKDLVPVAMLSSSTDEDVMSRAYQLGVHSYHTKPGSFTAFVELVSRLTRIWVSRPVIPF